MFSPLELTYTVSSHISSLSLKILHIFIYLISLCLILDNVLNMSLIFTHKILLHSLSFCFYSISFIEVLFDFFKYAVLSFIVPYCLIMIFLLCFFQHLLNSLFQVLMLFQVLRILIIIANHFSHGFEVFIVDCKSGPLEHLGTIRDSTPMLSILMDCDTPTWTLSRKGLPCYYSRSATPLHSRGTFVALFHAGVSVPTA